MDKAMEERKLNFLEEIIESDLASGKVDSVITRFPPEPNGYLHLGHAKSICLNFGLAQKYGGVTNLRYDDTNPTKEDTEYVDSIKEDIQWLGFQWDKELYASDYFDQLYEWAEDLIKRGLAYVDDQTQEEIRLNRGTVDKPGTPSPWRDRTPEENLKLFREMKAGKYAEGEKVLRAKIDMAHPNMMFRDPLLYRIKFAHHHRTGTSGASIRCTTIPTASAIPSSISPILSAHWSSTCTVRSMTGSSRHWASIRLTSTSLRALTSHIP